MKYAAMQGYFVWTPNLRKHFLLLLFCFFVILVETSFVRWKWKKRNNNAFLCDAHTAQFYSMMEHCANVIVVKRDKGKNKPLKIQRIEWKYRFLVYNVHNVHCTWDLRVTCKTLQIIHNSTTNSPMNGDDEGL